MTKIGDSIYCQSEGWSGVVMDLVCDEDHKPVIAFVKNHDPEDEMEWFCVPLDMYGKRLEARLH